mmetsp:Transcript_51901/g.151135  ORF Transcript_51901/g.151135 Transcript_51901/m.151135 type:complete len:412 (+) Transcript_51901:28-1263(+)
MASAADMAAALARHPPPPLPLPPGMTVAALPGMLKPVPRRRSRSYGTEVEALRAPTASAPVMSSAADPSSALLPSPSDPASRICRDHTGSGHDGGEGANGATGDVVAAAIRPTPECFPSAALAESQDSEPPGAVAATAAAAVTFATFALERGAAAFAGLLANPQSAVGEDVPRGASADAALSAISPSDLPSESVERFGVGGLAGRSDTLLGLAAGAEVLRRVHRAENEALEAPGEEPDSVRHPSAPSSCPDAYLWMSRTDDEIAKGIEHTLNDPDALVRECDELFHLYGGALASQAAQDVAAGGREGIRLTLQQLGVITQILIDKLGCRSEPVLARIGEIYHTAAAAYTGAGLGTIEFRGYVASVLTQIQRELQSRVPTRPLVPEVVQPAAEARDEVMDTGCDLDLHSPHG